MLPLERFASVGSLRSAFAWAARPDVHDAVQLDEVSRRAARDAEHDASQFGQRNTEPTAPP